MNPDAMIAQQQQQVEDLLREAKRQGASAASAAVSSSQGLSVNVRLGQVDTLEYNQDQGLAINVYFGQRKGTASTTDLSSKAIREAVSKACAIARYTSKDPCAGLAPAERMAHDYPDLKLYHPWHIDTEQAIEIARQTEQAALDSDPRITNSEGATVNTHQGTFVYGNSHGFIGGYPSSRHGLSCVVLATENGHMQRDYWFDSQRHWQKLASPESIGRTAAQRALAKLHGRKLKTTQAPVIFRAEIASSLLYAFISAIRGHAQYRESSFLLNTLGQAIFPNWVHIHENPLQPEGLSSAPFDNQGVATHAKDFVQDGILKNYVLDAYSACKLNMTTTGNAGGVFNLSIDSGEKDLPALLHDMQRGLLVTELMGQGVNSVTGDYSQGAAGFWVEHGEIQYPVEEITIAGNLREMFGQLLEVGTDRQIPGSIKTGSWLIENMTIAGN